MLRAAEGLVALDSDGRRIPSHATALAHWPDGSVRWAVLDLLLHATGGSAEHCELQIVDAASAEAGGGAAIHATAAHYRIATGAVEIELARDLFAPLAALPDTSAAEPIAARCELVFEDDRGRQLAPQLEQLAVERAGDVRLTLVGAGEMRHAGGPALCRFAVRLTAVRGSGLMRIDFTLHNPRRARHRGGLWDLGDAGSMLFRTLSINLRLTGAQPTSIAWRLAPDAPEQRSTAMSMRIHQASSGGERWDSRNHVDRTGRVALPFRGCRIVEGERTSERHRVSPALTQIAAGVRLSATCTKFWQQFPSAAAAAPDGLTIGLFPPQSEVPFELQGGERTTRTAFVLLAREDGPDGGDVAWVHDPLVPCLPPEYVAASEAFPHFIAAARDPHADYVRLTEEALDGPHSFFAKREAIDEYGWRNFGDTWADHEDVHYRGEHPVISHYNNQYDLLYGLLLHFARSADRRWFELAEDLARHVMDIDLYHTADDKPAYSGGPFWHTAHYESAGRATHRSYSADSSAAQARRPFGGGPSCEHNYTTGLLFFHYLTGDPRARAAVAQLADWVLRMDDGTSSLLGAVDPGPTGLASYTRTFDYHGPGRGAGNSINALLDAHRLVGSTHYLAAAEALIARCIHPRDDPDRLGLADAETRWSYTVFLQAVGKYLDHKCELGERDAAFDLARASLAHYARWMLAHETPFTARFDRVEYPTETWPAQDVRKSCVFDYAAQYGPPALREPASAAAEQFFAAALDGVLAFDTRACTRPLAILLANGVQRGRFRLAPPAPLADDAGWRDFASASEFRSQKERVRSRLRTASGWLALARAALQPHVWWRVATGRIW
jgi:hypothetical protein